MKISSSFNYIDKNDYNLNSGNKSNANYNQSFKGVPTNPTYIPNAVGRVGKIAGEYIGIPEQKLLMALTALMLVPLIDLKFGDEDKNTDAAIKSASKAIAGGFTGVTIRALFIKLADKYIGLDKKNVINDYLLPQSALKQYKANRTLDKGIQNAAQQMLHRRVKLYGRTMATFFAILTMSLFTNSKIDVPLTSDLQDIIGGVVKEDKTWIKSIGDVANSRKQKIANWFENKKLFFKSTNEKITKISNMLNEDKNNGKKEEVSK